MTSAYGLVCVQCGRLHMPEPEHIARAELLPEETFDDLLRCGRCGASSSTFVEATDKDAQRERQRNGGYVPVMYRCVVLRGG